MKLRHAVALGLLFSACTTTASVMKSWVGKPESQLLESWGAPDKDAALAYGGKVDTWVSVWGEPPHTCRKTFTVNSEGTIVKCVYSDCGDLPGQLGRPAPP